jgi:hypothetical protein
MLLLDLWQSSSESDSDQNSQPCRLPQVDKAQCYMHSLLVPASGCRSRRHGKGGGKGPNGDFAAAKTLALSVGVQAGSRTSSIPPALWEQRLSQVSVSRQQLNSLIMNWLVTEVCML